jgi:type I restriction enzyme, S subunit
MPSSPSTAWPRQSLGELCEADRGITYGIVKVGDYVPGGVPVIRGGDIRRNRIDFNDNKRVSVEVSAQFQRTILRGGEIVLNLIAEPGHSAVVPPAMKGFNVSRDVAVIPLGPQVNHRFVNYVLQSPQVVSWLTTRLQGSVTQKINLSTLRDVPVPLPPTWEQVAIAELLGAIDDKIEVNRRLTDLLNDLMRASFELRFRNREVESAGWPEMTVGDAVSVRGGSTPRTSNPAYWENGTIAWATPRDLSRLSSSVLFDTERHITEGGLGEISSGLLPEGTVLLSSRAPIGYLAIAETPVAINQGFIALVCDRVLPNLYVWQWAQSHLDDIKARANGTTFLEISKASFRPMMIAIPPDDVLNDWCQSTRSMYDYVVKAEQEIADLHALRDVLLPKLLSGELRVRNGEPRVGAAV